jgi:NAD(P)-dependent dehydrogenase (short-subunit alcohol dehydrogenase family)
MNAFERAQDSERIDVRPEHIRLDGRVALVTGGGGGIGQGVALTLGQFGAKVVVLDVEPARARRTVEVLRERGSEAFELVVDVTDTSGLRDGVDAAAAHFGRLDILVNNAGGVSPRPFVQQSERSWQRHIDINFVSMLAATSAAVPYMIAGGRGGSIVNVSSIEGSRAAPMYAVYAACKAAVNNFSMTMALELGEHGIRVNVIAPDHTITPGMRGNRSGPVNPSTWDVMSAEDQAALNDIIPLGREGLVEEIGSTVAFLSSPLASYITGVTIPVDGGTSSALGWLRDPRGGWRQTR